MKSRNRHQTPEGNYFRHGLHTRAPRPPRELSEDENLKTSPQTSHDATDDDSARDRDREPSPGGAWRPSEQAQAQPPSREKQAGQYGYGLGGEAHDNWGAFGGGSLPQNPGEGQDEPWQHHDADYLRWRAEHMRQLDEDYARWRSERFGKFAEEFSQWGDRNAQKHMKAPSSPHQSQTPDAPPPEGDASAPDDKLK